MYNIIIYACPDEFAAKIHGKVFSRRGLIKFLSRHANKLADYEYVAIGHDFGPASPVNFWLVGKKHMSDRIPTNSVFHLINGKPTLKP